VVTGASDERRGRQEHHDGHPGDHGDRHVGVDRRDKEAGKVGVWTKADSVTLFDDFGYGAK
jgi:hypothetical protein